MFKKAGHVCCGSRRGRDREVEGTNPEGGACGKEGKGKREKPDVEKARERADVREGERGHLSFSPLRAECGFSTRYRQEGRNTELGASKMRETS